MFVPSHLLLALVLFRALESTLADRNITIDDNDGAIKYSPGWSVSSGFNALDYQGSHHLTDNKSATANFTFTGVAVYIMAPLWPFAVGAQAGVDGSSPVAIDMQDHTHTDPTEQAPEDVNTTVLWGMEGLTNSSHTLQISFWSIEDWMTLDAIIYTVQDSSTPTASSTPSPTSSPKKSKSKTGIIAGVVAGAVVLGLIAIGMAMCLTRRRKNTVSGVSGAAGAAAFVGGSGGTTGSSRTYEGKSYAGTAHDSPTMVPVPLGSADSFGNRASQYPASFAGTADPYRDSLNMPSLPNAMPTNPGYGQPLSQYGGGSQYGMHDASVSQYGHPSNHTSYSPYDAQHASTASALAAATAAAAAGGAHLPYPGDNASNPAESRPPTVLPSAPQSFLAAPGQVVLSYAGAGASAVPDSSAGSSSSRSDVYTTKPSDASDEKRRLALAYRSEEEVDEPPPEYS